MTHALVSWLAAEQPTSSVATSPSTKFARRALVLAALFILPTGFSGCNKLKARDLLNKGVASFKNGQFDTAVEDFKQAKELDPDAYEIAWATFILLDAFPEVAGLSPAYVKAVSKLPTEKIRFKN